MTSAKRHELAKRHEHRANYTSEVDDQTSCEICYCGSRRYVTRDGTPTMQHPPGRHHWNASGWFYLERQSTDLPSLPAAEISKRHRELIVAALGYAQLCEMRAALPQVSAAARELESAAARWAIGLGRVGRAAKARP